MIPPVLPIGSTIKAANRIRVFQQNHVFDSLGGKAVGFFPGGKPVAIVAGWKDLNEPVHLWFEPCDLRGAVPARAHAAEGAAVVPKIPADELELVRFAGLFEVLAHKLERRLNGLRTAAVRLNVCQRFRSN